MQFNFDDALHHANAVALMCRELCLFLARNKSVERIFGAAQCGSAVAGAALTCAWSGEPLVWAQEIPDASHDDTAPCLILFGCSR